MEKKKNSPFKYGNLFSSLLLLILNLEELRLLSFRITGAPSCNLLIWVGGGGAIPAGVVLVVVGAETIPSQLVVSPLPGTPELSTTVIDRFTLLLLFAIPEFADT